MTLHGYHHLSNCSLQCISISPYVNDEYIANEWFNFSCFCFANIPGAFLFSATLHPHGAGPPPTTASTWMRRLRKTPRPSKRFTLAISWSKKIQKQIQSQWTVFHLFFIKSHSNHNLVRGQPGQVQSGLPYVATWPCDAEGPMVSSAYQVDVNEKGQLFHGAKRRPKRSGQDV